MYDGFVNISVILYINPIKGQISVQKILLKLNLNHQYALM